MALPRIDKLSYKQLLDLKNRMDVAMKARRAEEKVAIKQQISELASESGFSVDELMGGKRGNRKGIKVAIKYSHPEDKTLTWTGRGRQPRWLVAELKNGKKLESFTV